MKNKTLVIVSRSFAPLVIGSPILLSNLFESYKGKVFAIAGWQNGAKVDKAFIPPCEVVYLKIPFSFFQRIFEKFTPYLIWLIELFIMLNLKRNKADIVFGVYPSAEFFIAAYRASKKLRLPFIAHMHDLWEDNIDKDKIKKSQALRWEPIILKNANIVFCMTDVQKQFYKEKYGIQASILPHTIKPSKINQRISFNTEKIKAKEKVVVYTGNVSNAMNLDSLQQFIKTTDFLPSNIKIKMFVSWNKEYLIKHKIFHSRIIYDWLSMDKVQDEIKKANLLFLPLSFKNAAMKEVKTVFATKTLDYLVSGTPILVFSPSNSFHSQSAKINGWGKVVEKDNPEILAEEIINTINDLELSQLLVENAVSEAHNRNALVHANMLLNTVNNLNQYKYHAKQ